MSKNVLLVIYKFLKYFENLAVKQTHLKQSQLQIITHKDVNLIKHFFFVTDTPGKYAGVFVTTRLYNLG